jgi:predicted N-formylglutamate amidohydrolase
VSSLALIVTCEHASNAIPPELDGLGLPPEALLDHHAWDPGAAPVATWVADQLRAPLYLGKWSRLVADLNRPPDLPAVVPENSFGLHVPGNQNLDDEQRRDRVERYHRPYWSTVMDEIERRSASERVFHLSIHSFTPEYQGTVRTVSLGALFDPDYPLELELGTAMVRRLRELDFASEINEPYDGRAAALTTSCRNKFDANRYAGIEIEINQRHLDELDRVKQAVLEAVRFAVSSR